jgi:hypothetical protein
MPAEGHGSEPDHPGSRPWLVVRWAAWAALILAVLMVLLPVPGQLEDPDGEPVLAACGSVVAPVTHQEAWATEGCDDVRRPLRNGAALLVVGAVVTGGVLRRRGDGTPTA